MTEAPRTPAAPPPSPACTWPATHGCRTGAPGSSTESQPTARASRSTSRRMRPAGQDRQPPRDRTLPAPGRSSSPSWRPARERPLSRCISIVGRVIAAAAHKEDNHHDDEQHEADLLQRLVVAYVPAGRRNPGGPAVPDRRRAGGPRDNALLPQASPMTAHAAASAEAAPSPPPGQPQHLDRLIRARAIYSMTGE